MDEISVPPNLHQQRALVIKAPESKTRQVSLVAK